MGRMNGATVVDRDGEKIGTVVDVVLNGSDLTPRWVVIRYGTFRGHFTAVPHDRVYRNEAGDLVVESDRSAVLQAPRIRKPSLLSVDEERSLESYFNLARS
jgi:hypothetical protein